MSRTDKTAPYYVKVFYYPDWLEEFHDHSNNECDLPPRPRNAKVEDAGFWHRLPGHCSWVPSYTQFWTHGLSRCCCPMCKRYAYDEAPSRRERREGRRYCKTEWMKEY